MPFPLQRSHGVFPLLPHFVQKRPVPRHLGQVNRQVPSQSGHSSARAVPLRATALTAGTRSCPSSCPARPGCRGRRAILNTLFGGSFTSRLNQNLREDKGYTYGARSQFSQDGAQPLLVADPRLGLRLGLDCLAARFPASSGHSGCGEDGGKREGPNQQSQSNFRFHLSSLLWVEFTDIMSKGRAEGAKR